MYRFFQLVEAAPMVRIFDASFPSALSLACSLRSVSACDRMRHVVCSIAKPLVQKRKKWAMTRVGTWLAATDASPMRASNAAETRKSPFWPLLLPLFSTGEEQASAFKITVFVGAWKYDKWFQDYLQKVPHRRGHVLQCSFYFLGCLVICFSCTKSCLI